MEYRAGRQGTAVLLIVTILLTLVPAFLIVASGFPRPSQFLAIPLISCATVAALSLFRRTAVNIVLAAILLLVSGIGALIVGLEITWPPTLGRSGLFDLYVIVQAKPLGIFYLLLAAAFLRIRRRQSKIP